MAAAGRVPLGTVLVFLPAALLTLALSGSGIAMRSLGNDEYATWYTSTLSLSDLLAEVDAVVAPYYLLVRGWTAVAGDSETMLRLPSAVLMGVAAGLITLVGRRLFDAGAGLAAGLIFAGLPSVSRHGQHAGPGAFAIAAGLLALLLLLRAVEQPTCGALAAALARGRFGVACALLLKVAAALARGRFGVACALLLKVAAALARGRFGVACALLLKVAAALARGRFGVACALLLVVVGAVRAGPQAVAELPGKLFGSGQVAAVVIPAALLAAALLWSRHRRTVLLLITWAAVPMIFCSVTTSLPAWALLAGALGHGLVRFAPGTRPVTLSLSAMLVVAAVFFAGGPGQQAVRRSPVSGEPDFRSAAAVIAPHLRPGDGIAYAGTGRNGRRKLGYEVRRWGLPRDVLVAWTSPQDVGAAGRIWLVSATSPYQDPWAGLPAVTRAHLRATFARSEFHSFADVRVFVLNRKDPR